MTDMPHSNFEAQTNQPDSQLENELAEAAAIQTAENVEMLTLRVNNAKLTSENQRLNDKVTALQDALTERQQAPWDGVLEYPIEHNGYTVTELDMSEPDGETFLKFWEEIETIPEIRQRAHAVAAIADVELELVLKLKRPDFLKATTQANRLFLWAD